MPFISSPELVQLTLAIFHYQPWTLAAVAWRVWAGERRGENEIGGEPRRERPTRLIGTDIN